jgi:hypothetical protein
MLENKVPVQNSSKSWGIFWLIVSGARELETLCQSAKQNNTHISQG